MKFTCYRKETTKDGITKIVKNREIEIDIFKINTGTLLKCLQLFNIQKIKDNLGLYLKSISAIDTENKDNINLDEVQPLILLILDLLNTNPDEIYELIIELLAPYGGISYEEAMNAELDELVPILIESFKMSFNFTKKIQNNKKK